jgi:hypothetical protein
MAGQFAKVDQTSFIFYQTNQTNKTNGTNKTIPNFYPNNRSNIIAAAERTDRWL